MQKIRHIIAALGEGRGKEERVATQDHRRYGDHVLSKSIQFIIYI